ncbi:MAG: hypothetical protein ACFFF4_11895 [Candidatus Thorarchaeota archaeon]
MDTASAKSILSGKSCMFVPTVKEATGLQWDMIKFGLVSFLAIMMLFSWITVATPSSYSTVFVANEIGEFEPAQGGNIITYSLPEDLTIAAGNVDTYRGFAYVVDADDRIYFVDPIQDVTLQVTIPVGNLYWYQYNFQGVDIDKDGSTEFIFVNQDIDYEIVIVDFNDLSTKSYASHFIQPVVRGIGDFDADGNLDIFTIRANNRDMATIDLTTNSTMGSWIANQTAYYSIGKYHDGLKDYIAFGSVYESEYRNLTITDGNGTLVNQVDHRFLKDIETLHRGGITDDLVVIDQNGNATVYNGGDLSVDFETSVRDTYSTSYFYARAGNVTIDQYEDFYIFDGINQKTYIVDGLDGTVLHETDGTVIKSTPNFDVGFLDADDSTDALILDISNSPGLLRGADGVVSYIETLIYNPKQFIVHEVTGDNKEDMLLRVTTDVGGDIYIIKSDTEAPILTPAPMDPLHPTVLDDYITIKVTVDDSSPLDSKRLHYRKVGDASWIEPHDGFFSSPDGITHYAFLVGLDGGTYEYYIQFRDVFLNVGEVGSPSSPQILEVQGNLAWDTIPSGDNDTRHLFGNNRIAKGNQSDGTGVIYLGELTPEAIPIGVRLFVYDNNGNELDYIDLPDYKGYDFAVLSGNFDGDNVTDPVVIVDELSGVTTIYVLHGSNFTSNYNSTGAVFSRQCENQQVYDVDNDGLDELVQVTTTQPLSIGIMDDDGHWISRTLPFDNDLQLQTDAMAIGRAAPVSDTHIALERDENLIEIYRASDLMLMQSITPNYGAYTDADLVDIEVFRNASRTTIQFLIEFTLWDGTYPYTAFAFIDASTSSLDVADMYVIPERVHRYGHVFDYDADDMDEIIAISSAGEASLIEFEPSLSIVWNSTITDSTPTVSLITDFLGVGSEQIALFTDEDERLSIMDFNGKVHRNLYIGEVRGAFAIDNVDAGLGNEIAAFPIVKDGEPVLGAIRDLDWYYRLNVTVDYSPTTLIQGEEMFSEVAVRNIYDELVEDASININVDYLFEGETHTYTDGYFYNDSAYAYQARFPATWPIGVANLSVIVSHNFYHSWFTRFSDALTIQSPLFIEVNTPEIVPQGEDQYIEVWVRDSQGTPVTDANVSITIGSDHFSPTFIEPFYVYDNTNVTLPAGEYEVFTEAQHQYATSESNETVPFRVQTITRDLVIVDDLPRNLLQFQWTQAWFNITDPYGYAIEGADVNLRSGPTEYHMEELAPGCYRLSSPFDITIGYHSFDLNVRKAGFENPVATTVNVTITGELFPGIFYEPNVDSGGNLTIDITMKDQVGTVVEGTSVIVELGGVNYTATQNSTYATEFRVSIPINVTAGRNSFRVFSFATYASRVSVIGKVFYVHSTVSINVESSMGWEITQGDIIEISAFMTDRLGNPVDVSTATLFIGTNAYTLLPLGTGLYSVSVSTSGWKPNPYNYTVFVQDLYVNQEEPTTGELMVLGELSISVNVLTPTPRVNSRLDIEVTVLDKFNNPVPDLEVGLEIAGIPAEVTPGDEPGRYLATYTNAPNVNWGDYQIVVIAANEFCPPVEDSGTPITLSAELPVIPLDAESIPTYGITAGIAFLFSLFGLFVYFKVASSMGIEDETTANIEKSVKQMDRLYNAIVGVTGAGAIVSWLAYHSAAYEIAVILAISVLGASVLLYGIWLYRDSVASILVNDRLDKRRMVLGLWHLFFLPATIIMILVYGSGIQWFNQYVINASFTIGEFSIPRITTTIVTSFLSSILVVVFNVYRELGQGIKKLDKMEVAGTPQDVLEDERSLLIERASSSIRLKFLLFLVVVGGATVLSLDFILSQYSILLIVLIPVLFLVIIPFISSKVMQTFGFMKSKVTSDGEDYTAYT